MYAQVLKLYSFKAKQVSRLIGGNGIMLWSLMGVYPVWLRTYRDYPSRTDRVTETIAEAFKMTLESPYQSESMYSSIQKGLSHTTGYMLDEASMENRACKYKRILTRSKTNWTVWWMPNQPFFDAYDPKVMTDSNERNDLVILSTDGSRRATATSCTYIFSMVRVACHRPCR